jgi:hypothetical protein
MATFTEHLEEVIKLQPADSRDLQLEERRLARIRVDRRIFPSGVVNERAGVKGPKQTLVEPIGPCRLG